MQAKSTTVEIIAPSLEEAIEDGLEKLNVQRDEVEVEVLDEGKGSFLGIGKSQVRVRLILKNNDRTQDSAEAQDEQETEPEHVDEEIEEEVFPEGEPVDFLEKARREAFFITKGLLERMQVKAKVKTTVKEPEDEHDRPMVAVQISGKDLSILIGRRSETLNALQYITSLMLCQKLDEWVPLLMDVQGYRSRREHQLRQMARRLADQVVQTNRKQMLEPMPANERRIVHLELRYHPFVATESIGQEPNRRTTIFLKPKD